jgi:hypothetical protein
MMGPRRKYLESLAPCIQEYLHRRILDWEHLTYEAVEAEAITLFYYWVMRIRRKEAGV